MITLIAADGNALTTVAGLPVAVRNVIAAHKAIAGGEEADDIFVITERDSPAGRTIADALAQTTVGADPQWISLDKLHTLTDLGEDRCSIWLNAGTLVSRPNFFGAVADVCPLEPTLIAAGDNPVALAGPLGRVLRHREESAPFDQGTATSVIACTDVCQVRSVQDVHQAEKALIALSGKATDAFVSRYFNRPISQKISAIVARSSARPIHWTAVTAVCGLAAFAALVAATPASLIAGCVLFHLASVIDGVDGEIARVRFSSTPSGAKLDTNTDMAINILFFVGLSYGLYEINGAPYQLLGGYIVAIVALSLLLITFVPQRDSSSGSLDGFGLIVRARNNHRARLAKLLAIFHNLLRRDFFALGAALLAIAGQAYIVPWGIAIGATIWLGSIIVNVRVLRNASAMDLTPPHLRD